MNREDKIWSKLNLWRSGLTVGVAAILFFQQNSIGRREFDDYKTTQDRLNSEVLKRIEGRLDVIDRKLDRAVTKPTWPGSIALYTNLIGMDRNFSIRQ